MPCNYAYSAAHVCAPKLLYQPGTSGRAVQPSAARPTPTENTAIQSKPPSNPVILPRCDVARVTADHACRVFVRAKGWLKRSSQQAARLPLWRPPRRPTRRTARGQRPTPVRFSNSEASLGLYSGRLIGVWHVLSVPRDKTFCHQLADLTRGDLEASRGSCFTVLP
jgi:hypothetical protein